MQTKTKEENVPEVEVEYDLFISYSTDPDYKLSRKIESFLESFHKRIKSSGTVLKQLSVCRDGSDFSLHSLQKRATSSNEQEPVKSILVDYLLKSKYLLVFCSKNSARSEYVAFEIAWFLQNKGPENILLAVTEGKNIADEQSSIFSPTVLQCGLHAKPYFDLRGFKKESKDWRKLRDHEEELTNIAAFLNNDTTGKLIPLWRKEETQKLRRQRYVAGVIALVFLGLAVIAFFQRREAVRQKRTVENQLAKNYWTNSQTERAENNILSALFFTAEALLKSRDEEVKEEIMEDIHPFLPRIRLKNMILSDPSFTVFSFDGSKTLNIHNDTVVVFNLLTEKQIVTFKIEDPVNEIIFSSNGKKILTESYGVKKVWDAVSGKQIGNSFQSGGISLNDVLSPDGNFILTKTSEDTISLNRLSDGKKIMNIFHPFGYVKTPMVSEPNEFFDKPVSSSMDGTLGIFTPDGKAILTIRDKTLRLWDIATKKEVRSFVHKQLVDEAFFSEDGGKILSVTENEFYIWDVVSGKLVDSRSCQINKPTNPVFNHGGDKILIPIDSSIYMWWPAFDTLRRHTTLYKILTTSVKANAMVSSVVFSPDGKYFLSVNEKWVSIWNTESGEEITPSLYHEDLVKKVIFTENGKTILTATDKYIRKWEFGLAEESGIDLDKKGINHDAVFFKDQKQVIMARNADLFLWDIEKKQQSVYKKGFIPEEVKDVVFNFDGTKACIIKDSIALIMDVQKEKVIISFNNHSDIFSVDFSRNGKYFLLQDFGSGDTIRVYDLATGRLVSMRPTTDFDQQIFPEFSTDARLVMIKSDRYILIWDFINSRITDSIYNDHDLMNSAGQRSNVGNFSPDGKLMLSVSNNNIRIWDIQGKRIQIGFIHCNEFVDAAVFHSNSKQVLTISGSVVRTWDIRTGKQIGISREINGHPNVVSSSDGKYILLKDYYNISLLDNGSDLDLPPALFALQIKALTGVKFDANNNDLKCMNINEWIKLKEEFEKEGRNHYKSCIYPNYNVWKRFHNTETIR